MSDPDQTLVGLTLEQARAKTSHPVREVQRDGEHLIVTADYREDRINVATEGGKIVAIVNRR